MGYRYSASDLVVKNGRTTLAPKAKKPSKYRSVKTTVNGVKYDSKREAHHGARLEWMQKQGLISSLERQVEFVLIPAQNVAGRKERACSYVADFVFVDQATGLRVVHDVKSPVTRKKADYVLKRKLMLERHHLAIQEVL